MRITDIGNNRGRGDSHIIDNAVKKREYIPLLLPILGTTGVKYSHVKHSYENNMGIYPHFIPNFENSMGIHPHFIPNVGNNSGGVFPC